MSFWQWRKFMRLAAVLLSWLMVCQDLASAQARPGLKIVVLEGEGAVNNLELGTAGEPVVEVRDENDTPLAGAQVTFSLPERGPSGSFFGSGTNLRVTTDQQGRATGSRFQQNRTEGRFQIRVTAVYGERTGAVDISQSNVLTTENINRVVQANGKFGRGKLIAILTAGAIVGIVLANRDGNGSSTTTVPGTTITPGTVSVGTPR